MTSVRADERDRADFDLQDLPALPTDGQTTVHRAYLADRDRERQLLRIELRAVREEKAMILRPLRQRARTHLLEALSKELAGRQVVEDQPLALVDQEARGRQACHEVAREDQLQRLLRAHAAA